MSRQWFRQLRYPLLALAVTLTLLWTHHHQHTLTSYAATTRTHTVTISGAGFLPSQLSAKEGERVSLMIVNTDTRPHNLSIRELNLTSMELKPTQSTMLQFSAAKKGRFFFVSDAPGYPESGYQGMLIIE
ncbi:cupredoxin domain-containing protein [Brevibacillus parabrevis]|uniref:cupredoxin domain-containing protein n=1 Tax=Brevibacillus parabrevis TaxID=54914 RepID=UPI001137E21D|nr:cupredoxin domain-containing protein [Brevibacillus parabrevis]MED1723069.1 cupredoxin domain-containing protein [Brevibacillus parabrevis]TGV17682.1 cupredoxin domain-containing protein [Mesorhizobium sp. M00.F.Ca.ET.186.01.1.1]